MRLIVLFLGSALLFSCARQPQSVDLSEEIFGSQNLAIVVRDDQEFGRAYRLIGATYILDGETIFQREAPRGGALVVDARVFRGTVAPGPHVLRIELEYQPNDSRILRYRLPRTVAIESSREFVVLPDRWTTVEAVVSRDAIAMLIDYPEPIASR